MVAIGKALKSKIGVESPKVVEKPKKKAPAKKKNEVKDGDN